MDFGFSNQDCMLWIFWTALPALRQAGMLPCPMFNDVMQGKQLQLAPLDIDLSEFPEITLACYDHKKVWCS